MPLVTRTVSPIDVSRHRLNPSVQNDELECVANGTMANLIRQLSSLSSHAEQIFREVHHETVKLDHKTNTLFLRVERLSHKVLNTELDNEQVGIEDIHLRKAFKSTNLIDQHSLDRQTLPTYLSQLYVQCDAPPQLDLLNPYRDEKKSALRYYTDPSYFFDLWKEEMLKECGSDVRRNRAKSPNIHSARSMDTSNKSPGRKRKNRQPNQTSPLHQTTTSQANVLVSHYSSVARQQFPPVQQHSNDFMNFPSEYQAPQFLRTTNRNAESIPPPCMTLQAKAVNEFPSNNQRYASSHEFVANTNLPQSSIQGPPQPYSNATSGINKHLQGLRLENNFAIGELLDSIDDDDLPLPMPPPVAFGSHTIAENLPISTQPAINNSHLQFVPTSGIDATPQQMPSSTVPSVPPPPPPLPPPGIISSSFATRISEKESEMEKSLLVENSAESPTIDHRTNLLMEIQSGIKLKKVQRQEELASEKAAIETQNDVAAILRRRMEHVLGNDESSESPEDDDEWDD